MHLYNHTDMQTYMQTYMQKKCRHADMQTRRRAYRIASLVSKDEKSGLWVGIQEEEN